VMRGYTKHMSYAYQVRNILQDGCKPRAMLKKTRVAPALRCFNTCKYALFHNKTLTPDPITFHLSMLGYATLFAKNRE
jgi:hypothetical protein